MQIQTSLKTDQILYSSDHGIFKHILGNREVNAKYVKNLVIILKNDGVILQPCILNEFYEIIDGQHRIAAAAILEMEVPYVIRPGLRIEHARAMNQVSRDWSGIDNCYSFAATGSEEYILFLEFMGKFPQFGFTTHLMFLNNNTSYRCKAPAAYPNTPSFNKGTWKHKDIDIAETWALNTSMIEVYFKKGYNVKPFVRAMIKMYMHKDFDFNHFLAKLKAKPRSLVKCYDYEAYMELINEIYNHRKRGGKVNLLAA